jgi:hypothetical protein
VLLIDTGVLLAAADSNDPDHLACADVIETSDRLVTTAFVIAECAYLIDRQLGPTLEARFIRSIAHGDIEIEPLGSSDFTRVADLVERYASLPLGATDAGLVAVAERLDQSRIATLDHRHFTVVRPAHRDGFELLP